MEIIIGRKGNQSTPITDTTVSRQHCKVTDNGDGTYTVENLSSSGTKIDGCDIVRASARPESIVQLGPNFKAKLSDLLTSKPKVDEKPGMDVKTFNISHLRHIWENYNATNISKADEQRRINLTRTGLGIFTMCAMPTIFFFGPVGYALTAIGIAGNIYSFAGMKNSETATERQERQEKFDDQWVCPNPDCGRSLLAKNYRMLIRNYQTCPYCQCKYVEK